MPSLEVRGLINRQFIDPYNYFLSLIQEARRVNMINGSQFSELQKQLMNLLRDIVSKYNGGSSTSIKVESAEGLLLSMLYILNARFLTYPQPEIAVAAMTEMPISEHYQDGLKQVLSSLGEARELYQQVLKTRIDTDLIAYNDTVDEAIPGFFAAYDPRYQAHSISASIDYQLARPVDENLAGVGYIHQYLQNLLLENRFCQLFRTRDINRLLANYGQIYRIDYPEYLLNIFEIVFTNAILGVILEVKEPTLCFPREAIMPLYEKFQGKNYNQINLMVNGAWEQMSDHYNLSDLLLLGYIKEWLPQLLPRLHLALTEQTLDKLFITDPQIVRTSQIINLQPGSILDDEEFRYLTEQILNCDSAEDKTRLILGGVHSGTDFMDVLNADCLYGDEYATLFAALGNLELLMLIKDLGAAELRDGVAGLGQLLAQLAKTDKEWERQLIKYLSTLSKEQISSIDELFYVNMQITDQ
ncbi:MAG: DUF6179 domain-containing protein [Methylocystaceae bacterium]